MLNKAFLRFMHVGDIQRQSILGVISQIIVTIVGFFSTVYFAKTLGADILGTYFLFLSYFSLILTFVNFGFGQAVIKKISESKYINEYFSAFVVIRILSVTIAVIILLVFKNYFFTLIISGVYEWLILALCISTLSGITLHTVAGLGKVGVVAVTGMIDNLSRLIIQVMGVYMGYSLFGMLGGFVVGMLIGSLVQLKFMNLKFVRFGGEHIKNLMSFSLWSFIITSGVVTFHTVDTILIGHYMESSDIGVYRIGMQLSGVLYIVTSAMCASLYPKVSRWSVTEEYGNIEKSFSKGITYSLLVIIPLVMGGILLGDRILFNLYGADFAAGYVTFAILLISQLPNIFHSFFLTYLSAMDKLKKSVCFMMISVGVNIILNLVLIQMYGILGAAVACVLNLVLNSIMAWRVLNINIKIEIWNILLASFIMTIVVGLYRILYTIDDMYSLIVVIVLGGMVYIISIFWFDRKICNELKEMIKW